MKKSIFSLAVFCFLNSSAQNRSINFEHGDLASVFAKAKAENKMIFVDAYTSWCGPCKAMAKNVFTNDTVADYFNTHFVNYKLDMEKGEGIEFGKTYEVQCYPNLLVINSNKELVHRAAGYLVASEFISFAKNSADPSKTFNGLKSQYEKSGLNSDNVLQYFDLLQSACMNSMPLVRKYISSIKEEELSRPMNWKLINEAVNDYRSREIQFLLKNVAVFEKENGKVAIENKITDMGYQFFSPYIFAKNFDKTNYEKAKTEFKGMNWPYSEKIIFNSDLQVFYATDMNAYFDLAASKFQTYNNDNPNVLNSMAWRFYEKADKKEHLQAAVKMAKRASELAEEYAFMDTYAAVLFKSGNLKEADRLATKAIDKAKANKMNPNDYKETVELQKKIKALLN
jgi:thioredoxin-related protein